MKLKNLLAVTLAAITLVGCTKEIIKEVPVEGPGGTTEVVGDTYVKFSLDANMVKTRAERDHYSEEPTADEFKIYNYALFIFKSTGMLEATLVGKSSSLGSPILLSDASRELTFTKTQNPDLTWNDAGDAIRISAGAKTFFAIVNAPYEFIDDQDAFVNNNTLTLDELKEITFTLGGELNKIVGEYSNTNVSLTNPVTNGENRGFMMTSIIADGQSDSFRRMTLEERDEDDPAFEVTVAVGRAMAKVSLASDLKPYDDIISDNMPDLNQQYGALNTKEYRIINNPNEMNVALKTVSGIVVTPYMANPNVITANYFVSNNTSHEDPDPAVSYYIPVSKGPSDNTKTFNYCIENANNKPKYGNASIALIRGVYTPLTGDFGSAIILDANSNVLGTDPGDPNPLQPGDDFYRIWIKPYTDSSGDPQGGVYASEYFTGDPTLNLDAYRAYLTSELRPLPAAAELEVYKYPEGVCYYYLPLCNENSNSPYTVVRNSYYRIDIESVEGPGYPDNGTGEPEGPDKPGPEVPIEAQTNIKAKITVADWDIVDQPGKL